jgi:Family of unknown function (DUF6152)
MKIRPTLLALLITAYALITGSVWAHHGTGISYDLAHPPVILKGTVAEFRWANPHVILYIDVKDKNGQTVRWANYRKGVMK